MKYMHILHEVYEIYDKRKSDFAVIKTGIPRGYILGPLLFLVYIHDLPNANKLFKCMQTIQDYTRVNFF